MENQYLAVYNAILGVLRHPDEAQDCHNDFALHKLLKPSFQDKLAAAKTPETYLIGSARNFAKTWRRKLQSESSRRAGDSSELPISDPSADFEGAFFHRCDRRGKLAALRRDAPALLEDLCTRGDGHRLAATLRAIARSQGHDELGCLLALFREVFIGEQLHQAAMVLGVSMPTVRVSAHRLRQRLRRYLEERNQ